MGAAFAIDNVRGGSGARAVARVAQSPADGAILYVTTPTYIQTTLLSKPEYGHDSLTPVVTVFLRPRGDLHARAVAAPHARRRDRVRARRPRASARWGAANPASLERIAMERLNRVTRRTRSS